jgi:hypothetical protein
MYSSPPCQGTAIGPLAWLESLSAYNVEMVLIEIRKTGSEAEKESLNG